MYLQNDPWRGHARLYDKVELTTLFQRNGLERSFHRYYRELGWLRLKRPLWKRVAQTVIDTCFPMYREGHFAIFRKT